MGAKQAKPAAKPKAKPAGAQFVAPVGHQAQGAALARSQREAYELDAADGVVDGKFYGAEIKVTPQDVPPYTAPAAAAHHSMPGHSHATIPLHYNDAKPVYPEPRNDYYGPMHYRGQHSVQRYSTVPGHRVYQQAYQRQWGGYPVDTQYSHPMPTQYSQPNYWGEAPPVPRAYEEYNQPAWTSYEYTVESYPRPASAPGFGPVSYVAPPPPLPPQASPGVSHLPPATSLLPPSASPIPTTPPKSYYDTYSRFAKVEFHTVAKSPYQNLLENQSRNIGQLLTHEGVVARSAETTDQWVESVAQAPRTSHEVVHAPAAPASRAPIPTSAYEAPQGVSRFEAFKAARAAPASAPAPASPPPAPPAWDQHDNTTLGGFDADTSARMAFRRYDTDGNGFLDIYEFMAALKALNMGTSFKEAQDNFSEIDTDGGGSIEEEEFVKWYKRNFERIRESQDPKKLAQAIFRKYDKDGNGTLDVNEFVGAMRDLGLGYSLEDAQFVFDTFDNDGGGTIDEEEFVSQYYEQWLQQQ